MMTGFGSRGLVHHALLADYLYQSMMNQCTNVPSTEIEVIIVSMVILVTVMVVMIVIHGDNDNNNAYDDDDVDAYASFCDCLN